MTAEPAKRPVAGFIPDPADWEYHPHVSAHGSYHAIDLVERDLAPRQPIGFHLPGQKPRFSRRADAERVDGFPLVG